MAGPARRSFADIPIQTISGVDNVSGIQTILATHDRGMFSMSAQLCDAMMRDDRISGVLHTRVGALLATPLEVKAANSKAKATRVANAMQGDGEDDVGIWDKICPPSVIAGLSKWGSLLNFGLAEILWSTADGEWIPRLKLWHPQFVYWDFADTRYKLICREGVIDLPRVDENPRGDGKWLIWCPYGYQYGWLDALVRSLADKYLMRQWDYRDWARYNERHGMPILGIQTPQSASKEVKEEMVMRLANLGSDPVAQLPQIEGDDKYDIKLIEATARTYMSFQLFKKELDVDIAIAINGQNLTTEGGTDGGSRALGEVQNQVRIDKRKVDARLAQAIREQVLYWWALYNFGDGDLAPRPEYQVDPPEDELQEATALKTIGDAIKSHKDAGSPIDVRMILDRAGVPMISEEEEAAQAAIKAEEDAARMEAAAKANGPGNDHGGDTGEGEGEGDKPKEPANDSESLSSVRVPIPGPVKRYKFQDLPIAVENPAGTTRSWRDQGTDGPVVGSTPMLYDYGFIEGHIDGDGEELDCYVGHDESAKNVYVVHQLSAPDFKKHDENKVMLGFPSADAATAAYVAHRNDGDRAIGGMSVIPLEEFKRKLKKRTGTGKIRASALPELATQRQAETVAALVELSNRPGSHAVRSPSGQRRAKFYADGLSQKGKRLAARALAVDLSAIREEIDSVKESPNWPEELKGRILVRFRNMDPQRLAGVVAKARIMAVMGGRLSALQEV